jgi:hypothetical protein
VATLLAQARSASVQASSPSAQVKVAVAQVGDRNWNWEKKIFMFDYVGNWRAAKTDDLVLANLSVFRFASRDASGWPFGSSKSLAMTSARNSQSVIVEEVPNYYRLLT